MKRGCPSGGYTIVEVMIFLAITGAMFASAFMFVAGQQRKTEFMTATRNAELLIQDIINDVPTGYYGGLNNYTCSQGAAGPVITSGASERGTNSPCIFLGRAIQFGVAGSSNEGYQVYDIVGLRRVHGVNVETLSEAKPTILPASGSYDRLPGGLFVKSVRQGGNEIGSMAFISTLARYSASSDMLSGSQSVDLYPLAGSTLGQDETAIGSQIEDLRDGTPLKNPTEGVVICLEGGATNQYAEIAIGADSGKLTTKLEVKSGSCPA